MLFFKSTKIRALQVTGHGSFWLQYNSYELCREGLRDGVGLQVFPRTKNLHDQVLVITILLIEPSKQLLGIAEEDTVCRFFFSCAEGRHIVFTQLSGVATE